MQLLLSPAAPQTGARSSRYTTPWSPHTGHMSPPGPGQTWVVRRYKIPPPSGDRDQVARLINKVLSLGLVKVEL